MNVTTSFNGIQEFRGRARFVTVKLGPVQLSDDDRKTMHEVIKKVND